MRDLYGDRYDPQKLARPGDVAETCWLTDLQPAGAWSNIAFELKILRLPLILLDC